MNARLALLVVIGAVVALTPVAAAGPEAAKQRVAITVTILPSGEGVLTPLPLGKGALARDAGTFESDNCRAGGSPGGAAWCVTGSRSMSTPASSGR